MKINKEKERFLQQELREYEKTLVSKTNDEFFNNVQTVKLCVEEIVRKIKGRNL